MLKSKINRYSCKKYSSRQVEEEKLEAILNAGRLAPTAKNLQEQHVYVLRSEEMLARIEEKLAQGRALMKRLHNAGRFGYPVFVVLDEQGQVLHLQDSGLLEEGESYNQQKVMSFFKNWTPKAVGK